MPLATLWISIQGPVPSQRMEKELTEGAVIRIGRAPQSGWSIPWDMRISREHADLCWKDGELCVDCTEVSRNPIVYNEQTTKNLIIVPGESFQIGETIFQASPLAPEEFDDTNDLDFQEDSEVLQEHAYSSEELRRIAFGNTEQQMEILANLPQLISGSRTDEELGAMLSRLLLQAIPQAEAISVAHIDVSELPADDATDIHFPKMLTQRVETRDDFRDRFIPSRRLILKTLQRQTSMMHIWGSDESSADFTVSAGLGWAFCVPIGNESTRGWCLYVSGKGAVGSGFEVNEKDPYRRPAIHGACCSVHRIGSAGSCAATTKDTVERVFLAQIDREHYRIQLGRRTVASRRQHHGSVL